MTWQIGGRYGNNRTEILDEIGSRAIATVWTHDRKADNERPRGDNDYIESPDGMANLRLIVVAPELRSILLRWTEYAINHEVPFALIADTRAVLRKADKGE